MGTLFDREIVLSMRKKYSRRTRLTLRSIISNSKYSYQPEDAKKQKKNWCHRHLKTSFIILLKSCSPNTAAIIMLARRMAKMRNRGIIFMEM